jgi:hypothetical protein
VEREAKLTLAEGTATAERGREIRFLKDGQSVNL